MDLSTIQLLVVVAVIIISMTLHEIAHGYTAFWLGDQTPKAQGRLSLNPLKHLDPFMSVLLPLLLAIAGGPIFGGAKPVQVNPLRLKWGEWGMALVAIAGPVINFIIAFTAFGFLYHLGPHVSDFWNLVMALFVQINLGFMIFNLLPIPPLDGSRVLYALAPSFIQDVMQRIERFGVLVVMALVLLFSPFIFAIMSNAINLILSFFFWVVS